MANELDKTIEELEAEVLDELEEASSDPMQKLKTNKEDGKMTAISNAQPEGKVQTDATKAVNDPDDALGAKAAKATKKDTTIKNYLKIILKIAKIEKQTSIIYDHSKPNGTPRKVLDVSLAKKYGWIAKTNTIDALKKTYYEFKKNNKY